jgi:hypothetical protein
MMQFLTYDVPGPGAAGIFHDAARVEDAPAPPIGVRAFVRG